GGSEIFLRVAVGLGCPDARDLAENFARSHPSDRMRLTALEAQAGVLGPADRDELWRRAESSGSRLVALEARRIATGLERAARQPVDCALQDHGGCVAVDPLCTFRPAEILCDHVAFGGRGGPAFVPQQDWAAASGKVFRIGAACLRS